MSGPARTPTSKLVAAGPALGLAVLGAAVAIAGSGYGLGEEASPGPGAFPLLAGGVLALLGAVTAFQALRQGGPAASAGDDTEGSEIDVLPGEAKKSSGLPFRPILAVGGGILVWVLIVERLGFIPAGAALVAIAALALPRSKPLSIAILAAALCIAGWLLFIVQLGAPLRPFTIAF